MSAFERIGSWLGITVARDVRVATARRNMPIVTVGSFMILTFAGMLAFSLLTGTSTSVDGFDAAAHESPEVTARFTATCVIATVVLALTGVFGVLYLYRKWERPHLATLVTVLFSFTIAMLWGVADSGRSPDNQILIFASIQFLVSGLLVLSPIVSLTYFAATFAAFGLMLNASGQMLTSHMADLGYLCLLDVVVSWVIYALHRRGLEQTLAIADKSRRDELTGARNRHYLRDDFPTFLGKEMFVMLCDIDDFKHYNDDFSHDTGDDLLKRFFSALRDSFGDECVYRYGGDEFLVVSPDLSEAGFLDKVAKCAHELEQVEIDGTPAGLTFSGGYVYGAADDGDGFRHLMHVADEQLLHVKQIGKAQVLGASSATGNQAPDDRQRKSVDESHD